MEISDKIQLALSRIDKAYQAYRPIAVYGLFSGGHDSLTATYIASLYPAFTAAVHINTGIGVDQTRVFVRDTCAERGWPLLEYKAMENCRADGTLDPQDYRKLVLQYGFPGPPGHGLMYVRLKDRQIARLLRDTKKGHSRRTCAMFISGARSQESQRRMANTEEIQKQGGRLWCAPIHDFTKTDCGHVIEHAGLKRNEVVDLIHKSGECLCGAFAKKGELDELAMWFPEKAREIRELEKEVMKKFPWGWEDRPPKKQCARKIPNQPLCHNCNVQYELDLEKSA